MSTPLRRKAPTGRAVAYFETAGLLLTLALGACRSDGAPGADSETPQDGLRARAGEFQAANMPLRDREALSPEFLAENLDLALAAREEFPWAAAVPEALFLNDVLPYAVFDERRDPWRRELLDLCRPIVANSKSASDAAQSLNRELFAKIGLHYNTSRERANQSFAQSRASGKASCTGLSIALVEACRSVGIPARAVGTPSWAKKAGNHTWVEIWDGEWKFTGADEYDAGGLNRGWFVGDAGDARADKPENRIYATSWARTGDHFPLAWSASDREVAAVDVTARYAKTPSAAPHSAAKIFVRVLDRKGGERIVVELELLDGARHALAREKSRAGTSDLNDMAQFMLPTAGKCTLRLTRAGEARFAEVEALPTAEAQTCELYWDELLQSTTSLETESSPQPKLPSRIAQIWGDLVAHAREERQAEMQALAITQGDKTLSWLERTFGDAPEGNRSLWISMHGGGGAPATVNDQQWKNQIGLYQPDEGFYVAPRAPTDTWNLWHEAHIDALFGRLIENYVALRGVDPNRVYLMGYSAGGDGVWQLAPRMADRFAAAAMMAGHPNEASLLGLRNLPFAILMGGDDSAYNRNGIARERAAELDALEAADHGGYGHFVRIYEGLGHWMKKKDAEALPWMANFQRNPWPKKIVWFQDDVLHKRFYWLGRKSGAARVGDKIFAQVDGQTIRITAGEVKEIELWLSDELLDLSLPVIVEVDGRRLFEGVLARSDAAIRASLEQRLDPSLAACAKLELSW